MGNAINTLIVGNESEVSEHVLESLTDGGFVPRWRQVGTPGDLAECVESEDWDVVILDDAPGGIDAASALETLERLNVDLPAIVVSDKMAMVRAVALMKMGADDFIPTHELERLPQTVQRELDNAGGRRSGRSNETEAWRMANFDPLTELPNRRLFFDRLSHALKRARRDKTGLALLYLDLDHFKWINDTLGHASGDGLLAETGRRLREAIRDSDTAARIGGDEFAIVLPGSGSRNAADSVARKILTALSQPMAINGNELTMTISIGIALFPDDGTDSDTLLHNADMAMYQTKRRGRNGYRFFSPEILHNAALPTGSASAPSRDRLRPMPVATTTGVPPGIRLRPAETRAPAPGAVARKRTEWPLAAKVAFGLGLLMMAWSLGTSVIPHWSGQATQIATEQDGRDLQSFAPAAGQ
ncbi:MAG: diguanylate cyclase [Rhodobacterales bacterium]|nr:diguanylate cyclase [Rhodobacterales bacterium]